MTITSGLAAPLSHSAPACGNARLALLAIRRMGAHGLTDAAVAEAYLGAFGQGFRRPLVLMRALMQETATTATQTLSIAPCCCPRLTASEAAFLRVLAEAPDATARSRLLLADLVGTRNVDALLATAAAVSVAFAEAGRPIG